MSSQGTDTPVVDTGRGISPARIRTARLIAVAADAVQIGLLPFFGPGALSIANDVLDVVIAAALLVLVGWHWAFLPSFVAELVPGLDLVPTWTVAVWLATRGRSIDSGNASQIEGPTK